MLGSRIRKPGGWGRRAARLAATAGAVLALITNGTAFAGSAAGQVVPEAQAARLASAPAPAALAALYCRTPKDCVAVGANSLPNPASLVSERWNGVRWSRSALPVPAGTVFWSVSSGGVACPTARECVAVGPETGAGIPLAEYWNGSHWSVGQAAVPNSGIIDFALNAISCPAQRDCYAVGSLMGAGSTETEPLIEHWNGSGWSVQAAPGGMGLGLSSISCRTTSFCVAVGNGIEGSSPVADLWNGRTWTETALPWTAPVQISSVSCPAVTSCFVVGPDLLAGGGSLVWRWNGKTWSAAVHTPGPAASVSDELQSVSCGSPTRCLAVGNDTGGGYAIAWNGHGWRSVAVTPAHGKLGYFEQVQCLSATSCTALGATTATAATQRFETAFWNGRTWRIVPTV